MRILNHNYQSIPDGLTFALLIEKIMMMNLDISKITSCGSDWETNRYTFLQTIKSWQNDIRKNRLFPALDFAWQLQNRFNDILSENI